MILLIKRTINELRILYIFILRLLLPINFYLIKRSLNFPKINLHRKSKFERYAKYFYSSVNFKNKKLIVYRIQRRFFRWYKFYSEDKFTSVELILNNKKKIFANAERPMFFKNKNKIFFYFEKGSTTKFDNLIYLYDTHLKKTYKISSPFNFNGKNWIPVSGLKSLVFVYSIDPLVILKVTDLKKGKMKAITKIKQGFKPGWDTRDIDTSFVGSKRGGSPVVKVGKNQYLGIGHSTKWFFKIIKQFGSTQRAYIYYFDFKKKNYYYNYLTNNKIGCLYCSGAELTPNKNIIKFSFTFSSFFNESIFSNIYLFEAKLNKKKLIKIAKKGTKKKIEFTHEAKGIEW